MFIRLCAVRLSSPSGTKLISFFRLFLLSCCSGAGRWECSVSVWSLRDLEALPNVNEPTWHLCFEELCGVCLCHVHRWSCCVVAAGVSTADGQVEDRGEGCWVLGAPSGEDAAQLQGASLAVAPAEGDARVRAHPSGPSSSGLPGMMAWPFGPTLMIPTGCTCCGAPRGPLFSPPSTDLHLPPVPCVPDSTSASSPREGFILS